jgi:hypothetical protein
MHAALERYVELKLARGLLHRAIQQVRGEQQDPLVREAGRLPDDARRVRRGGSRR